IPQRFSYFIFFVLFFFNYFKLIYFFNNRIMSSSEETFKNDDKKDSKIKRKRDVNKTNDQEFKIGFDYEFVIRIRYNKHSFFFINHKFTYNTYVLSCIITFIFIIIFFTVLYYFYLVLINK